MAVSAGRLSTPKIQQTERTANRQVAWEEAWPRQKTLASVFRLAAFTAAIIQIAAFPNGPGYDASKLTGLVIAGGIYSILKLVQPFRWQQGRTTNVLLLSVDIAVCLLLVHFSGGIHSPFILYTLLPVLTASLVKDYTVTVMVSAITAAYVLVGNIYNPATNYMLTLQGVNDFMVYSIALGLVAALPYAINLRTSKRLQSEAVTTERQRVSHELHDSVCQTLCALRWQFQRLSQHIPADDHFRDELKKIEESVNIAEQDARDLLEAFRTLGTRGGFLSHIRHYLEQMKHYAGINYQLEYDGTDLELAESTERELSMICIEALTNVKKHAGARNVRFSAGRINGHVLVKIIDDGIGFDDSVDSTRLGHHGLSIMRERSEAIGGTVRITSIPGTGTEIVVEIPGGGG